MSTSASGGRGLLLASRLFGALRPTSCSCLMPVMPCIELEQPSTSGRTFCTSGASCDQVREIRRTLLEGALKYVKERGWTNAALVAAARDLKLSPASTGLLARGPGELVEYFMELCNSRCAEELQARKAELQNLPLNERVAKALQLRLELVQPVVDSWPQALAIAAQPVNAPHSIKVLFKLVDDIWDVLGDDATDVTWYSKRAVLAGIYTSTSLYMLTDYSPGFRDTWEALQRRVDEGLALDASLQRAVHSADNLGSSSSRSGGNTTDTEGSGQPSP